jgi:hypothetical protein
MTKFHVKHFCKVCPTRNALRLVGFSAINSAKGARQQDEDGPIKLCSVHGPHPSLENICRDRDAQGVG